MISGEGIDPKTNLPNLSLLGEDHYWEIVPFEHPIHGRINNRYRIAIMREVEVKYKSFFVTKTKTESVIVDVKNLSRKRDFKDLTDKVVSEIKSYVDKSCLKIPMTAQEFYNKIDPYIMLLNIKSEFGSSLGHEDLVEFDLSDDLIQLCSMELYSTVMEKQTKKLNDLIREKRNNKYVGKYPPNKLGGVS